jgi:hypothetical protein
MATALAIANLVVVMVLSSLVMRLYRRQSQEATS